MGGMAPLIWSKWLDDSQVGNPLARDLRMNVTTTVRRHLPGSTPARPSGQWASPQWQS